MIDRPIVILGCPRSGTQLVARMLGQCGDHFLITEHKDKSLCPEDRAGLSDNEIWWRNCAFEAWDQENCKPLVETPVFDQEAVETMARVYRGMAQGRRLVLKNPQNVTRVPFLKAMFPNALFVFCVRHPWHTIQSMSIKDFRAGRFRDKSVLRTKVNLALPQNQLLRAAHSWSFAIETYLAERDDAWTSHRYEDLVSMADEALAELFTFLSIDDDRAQERAASLPRDPVSNFYVANRMFAENAYQNEIIDAIQPGCEVFAYEPSPAALPSDATSYYLDLATLKHQGARMKRLWRGILTKPSGV